MTVIEFGKRDYKINTLITVLFITLIISAVCGIALYNYLISLRHDVAKSEDLMAKLQVETAELKNKLYNVIDGASNSSFIQSTGLIIEKNPQYVTPATLISQVTQ